LYVYQFSTTKGSSETPNANTKLNYVLYPVVSRSHPLAKTIDAGHTDKDSVIQALSSVSIVVKTNRFATKGSIPQQFQNVDNLEGLIINNVESLGKKEVELLHESFPQMDASKVIFIEQGRLPKPLVATIGMIAGGVVLALLGLFWMIARR